MVISTQSDQLLEQLAGLRNSQTIQKRLAWLEDRLFWIGELNRADLVARFSISPQQATGDIKKYQELAPANLAYDRSRKLYTKADGFEALFAKSAETWLATNAEGPSTLRAIRRTSVKPIKRGVGDEVLIALSRAFRLRLPISVLYQSMIERESSWLTICPHNFVETEIRWHVRAWVDSLSTFTDIVPGRILEWHDAPEAEWVGADADSSWNTMVDIVLVPSKALNQAQSQVVQRDFNMIDGQRVIATRECLVYYQLSAMYLVDPVREYQGEPKDRNFGVAVQNWQLLLRYVTGPQSARPI